MRERQAGFPLVELVVVIVILGVLAAVAIPRYTSYVGQARVAALNGLAGALRSAVVLVQARYVATGATTSPVTMADGMIVAVGTAGAAAGIPLSSAGGIENAVKVDGTFIYDAATGTYNFLNAVPNCFVNYSGATGAVTVTSGGCGA